MRLRTALLILLTGLGLLWLATSGTIGLFHELISFHVDPIGYYPIKMTHAVWATWIVVLLCLLFIFAPRFWQSTASRLRPLRHFLGPIVLILFVLFSYCDVQYTFSAPFAIQGLLILTIVLATFLLRNDRPRIAIVIARISRAVRNARPASIGALVLLAALIPLLWIKFFVYQDVPMTGDGACALFQGVLLAHGKFRMLPDMPEFYNGTGILWQYGVCSMYPPGQPVTLALGELFHAAWLIGPLCGALTALMVFAYGDRWFGRAEGILAAALLIASPHFLAMSPTYMTHTTASFYLAMMLFFALVRCEDAPGWGAGAVVGFAAGMAFITRPLTAVAIGLPIGLVSLWRQLSRRNWRPVIASAVALFAVALFFLFYNYKTTGNAFVSGYHAAGPHHRLGFGWPTNHTPWKGLLQGLSNLWEFNRWAPGAFPGAYLWLALWIILGPFTWREMTLAASWLMLPICYFFYYYQDFCIGPRFLFEATVPGALLAAQGLSSAAKHLARSLQAAHDTSRHAYRILAYLGAAIVIGSIPICFHQVTNIHGLYENRAYMKWRKSFYDRPNVVVFQIDNIHSIGLGEMARYPDGPLFLQHQGDAMNRKFMKAHPDRIYYIGYTNEVLPYEEAPQEWREKRL